MSPAIFTFFGVIIRMYWERTVSLTHHTKNIKRYVPFQKFWKVLCYAV